MYFFGYYRCFAFLISHLNELYCKCACDLRCIHFFSDIVRMMSHKCVCGSLICVCISHFTCWSSQTWHENARVVNEYHVRTLSLALSLILNCDEENQL